MTKNQCITIVLPAQPIRNWSQFMQRLNFFKMDEFHVCHGMESKLLKLAVVIPHLKGNSCNGYIHPYFWVDDHPLPQGTGV